MKVRTAVLLMATIVAAACERGADSATVDADVPLEYDFTPLQYPGATATIASDINDAGDIVGWYIQDQGARGFLYRNGAFTTIEYPGAVRTQINGIAEDGAMVGAYRLAGEPPTAYHPFRRTAAGDFVEITHADFQYGMMQRILADGTMVGCFHNDDFATTMFAAAVHNGHTTLHDVAGTMYTSGTPDGRRLVGNSAPLSRGFILEGDSAADFAVPGATLTEIWDLNAAGTIVGVQTDSTDVPRGYVHRNGTWTTVVVPGSQANVIFGVNASDRIVGVFQDSAGARSAYIGEPRRR